MAPRNLKGSAPALTDEILKQIAKDLTPIRKDDESIFRGHERMPIISVRTPAKGTLLTRAATKIKQCAGKWNLEAVAALRFLKSGVAGYVVAEPVATYDPTAPDQHELKWNDRKTTATIDLRPVLQPRGL